MKDVYGKLREEHIQLLRSDSEKKKQISSVNEKLEQVRLEKAAEIWPMALKLLGLDASSHLYTRVCPSVCPLP